MSLMLNRMRNCYCEVAASKPQRPIVRVNASQGQQHN